ncbi:MAG: FtsX-like permease family protein [Myxococcaceae bacterium]|jgi:ABC-type lipoprotein release transport system permease subunit|nr:FtsX-like permease family protein [Myxococcaceae bacterium]
MGSFVILVRIALANITSSLLNVFVGSVLLFGTALLVVGGSLFSTLDGSLSRSIVDSVTGNLQVYAARSKDPLEVYGKFDGTDSELAPLEDFPALEATLTAHPNVAAVVPMGGTTAQVMSGNTIDVTLEKLRDLYRAQRGEGPKLADDEFRTRADSLVRHMRNIVGVLGKDLETEKELSDGSTLEPAQLEAVATASTDAFWASFDDDPFGHLELLENRVAPLVADADLLFFRCLGTDLGAFQARFPRMQLVSGTAVPEGRRGILLPSFVYEEYFKLKNARRLDKIRDARAAGRRLSDEGDAELRRFVRENQSQTREIVLQLDGLATAKAVAALQQHLGRTDPDLAALLEAFFGVTDETFDARYRFFYAELAPLLTLYRAKVGDRLTLRSFARTGSASTVTLTLYGIFELRGLEKSPLAGVNTLIDLASFRDLYGIVSAEAKAEADAMKAQVGAAEVSRDDAEAALFGDTSTVVVDTKAAVIADERAGAPVKKQEDTFDPAEAKKGVVLHAAVLLKDGSDEAVSRTLGELEDRLAATKGPADAKAVEAAAQVLGSGRLPPMVSMTLSRAVALERERLSGSQPRTSAALVALLEAVRAERPSLTADDVQTVSALVRSARPAVFVVSWQAASGFIGKSVDFFRLALLFIVAAFAFVALIVVTLGMTVATLQRTQTIGTLRAIGAQRRFVTAMVLVETAVLSVVFGLLGAAVGAGVVKALAARGIPAFRDELYFFFSGPVLRPELSASGVVVALVVTMVVSLLAVIFPTWLATRVSPVTAMQATE